MQRSWFQIINPKVTYQNKFYGFAKKESSKKHTTEVTPSRASLNVSGEKRFPAARIKN